MERLRDIHLPPPIAPDGLDWLSLMLISAAILACVLLGWTILRRPAWKREAEALIRRASNLPPGDALFEMAKVLRRIALKLDGTQTMRTITGTAYARRLNELLHTVYFTEGAGAALIEGLYRRHAVFSPEPVAREIIRLLRLVKVR